MIVTTPAEKVINACWRLNAEAYEAQVIANHLRPLKRFIPCEKAVELMLVISEGKHFGTANMKAQSLKCACHVGMTPARLLEYEMDETYKLASYNGDKKTLYPRLWKGN